MLGNIGDLFVKYMRQVTKGHLYHPLGVLDYYVMNRHRVTDPLRWFCNIFFIKFVVRGREF